MGTKVIEISLFGACAVRSATPGKFEITGSKHKALFALLATAPFGRRTRAFLQNTLWGTACYDSGRQSLRRALSDIKLVMNGSFADILTSTNSDITLDLSKVTFVGRPGGGEFLEGIDLREDGFNRWLQSMRLDPEQVFALYSPVSQVPPPAMRPSLTILPFRLVHGEPEHAPLGDWLAEEICRSLSRSNLITVISHLSARELSKTSIKLSQVHTMLGVQYCMAGSIRIIDGKAILGVDFLDAVSGRILWTREYSGSIHDFLGSEIASVADIVQSIGRSIASDAIRYTRGRNVRSIPDHGLLIAGVGLMHELRLSSFARSRELIEEAILRAPLAAEAHAWLAEWYVMSVYNGWSTDNQGDIQNAADHSSRALDIDPENALCLTVDGVVHNNLLLRMDVAEDRFNAALDQNPNESMSWLLSGVLHAYRDEGVEAVRRVEKASRLSPLDPMRYFFDSLSASAHIAAGNYLTALELSDRSLAINNRHLSTLRAKACALHKLGRGREATETGREILRRQPDFRVNDYLRNHPAAEFNFGKMHAEALIAAGIPREG